MRKPIEQYKSIISLLEARKISLDEIKQSALDNNRLASVTLNALYDLAQCEEDMLTMANRIRIDLDGMSKYLEDGYRTSDLGILQRHGVELDMLSQRRGNLIEKITGLLYIMAGDK